LKKSDNKGLNLKCIGDRYQVSLPELRTCVGAYKLRRKVIEDDQRFVIMVNELRDSLSKDNIIQGFNIDQIQDILFVCGLIMCFILNFEFLTCIPMCVNSLHICEYEINDIYIY
jgi:hypothetical protein